MMNLVLLAASVLALILLQITEAWQVAAAGFLLVLAGSIGHQRGWWVWLWAWLRPHLVAFWHWFVNRQRKIEIEEYDLHLGHDVNTGEPVIENLEKMKSIALFAVNGGGKTSALHGHLDWLITHNGPERLQVAISDLKEVDFALWSAIPHLFCPIARTVEQTTEMISLVKAEMENRARLFNMVAGGKTRRLCNDLRRYHKLKKELRLNLPDLPRLFIIFDEISTFTRNTDTLTDLILIGEKGRAYGIQFECSTQYPVKESIPTALREQLPTRLVGAMSSRAYKVAEVYKDDWEGRSLRVGQFFAAIGNNGSSYRVIQSRYVTDRELEENANRLSRGYAPRMWPTAKAADGAAATTATTPYQWQGSDEQKRVMVLQWFEMFKEQPKPTDFVRDFGASRATFYNFGIPALWEESQSNRLRLSKNSA
jgi:hypothetical protein